MNLKTCCRVGDYKLIAGYPGHDSGWYPPERVYSELNYTQNPHDLLNQKNMEKDIIDFNERVSAGNESYYKLFNLKGKEEYTRGSTYVTPPCP